MPRQTTGLILDDVIETIRMVQEAIKPIVQAERYPGDAIAYAQQQEVCASLFTYICTVIESVPPVIHAQLIREFMRGKTGPTQDRVLRVLKAWGELVTAVTPTLHEILEEAKNDAEASS